jgi:hydroxymethylpyrimidine/phosphomethylpyrimidine kinase
MNLRVNLAAAALAAALAAGLPLPEAARRAAAVAGDAVAHGLAGIGKGDGPVHVLHSACLRGADQSLTMPLS